ncbi:hypothetical protein B0J17DRAFT_630337 [Rhizoctonia solani]|nr:hypothetical protein B0J17DRAFT_630337 [Rhizoctonia solani]
MSVTLNLKALEDEESAPQLPPEIIWIIIIKDLLVDLSTAACRGSEAVTSYIPPNILKLNRYIHKLVLTTAYDTIALTSPDLLYQFGNVVSNLPHLACLVHNLWVSTPRLGTFAVGWISSVIAIGHILSKAPMIKRFALPTSLFLLEYAKLGSAIEHITIGGGEIPELPCKVKTVHIYGPILCSRIPRLKRDALRHVVCDMKRPCRPGEIGRIIQELLGDGTAKVTSD